MCLSQRRQGPWTVYLSMDCQQTRYWDDSMAEVHEDILSTVQTLNSTRSTEVQCIDGFCHMKTFVVFNTCLSVSKFGRTHQTRPLTTTGTKRRADLCMILCRGFEQWWCMLQGSRSLPQVWCNFFDSHHRITIKAIKIWSKCIKLVG